MKADKEKIEKIIGFIQLKNSLKDEKWIEESQLYEAVGEEISNELYYLRESGVIDLNDRTDRNYIGFTKEASEEIGKENPFNIEINLEELDELVENSDEPGIEYDDLLDKGMELKHPEKYVAALKPFGDAVEQNSTMALSEKHIERYTGEDLGFELRTLAEWGYLEELGSNDLGITRTDSSFYRLNIEDREVNADAVFSAQHIERYYGGSVEQFLNEYSEQDSDALRKNGINFYKTAG